MTFKVDIANRIGGRMNLMRDTHIAGMLMKAASQIIGAYDQSNVKFHQKPLTPPEDER